MSELLPEISPNQEPRQELRQRLTHTRELYAGRIAATETLKVLQAVIKRSREKNEHLLEPPEGHWFEIQTVFAGTRIRGVYREPYPGKSEPTLGMITEEFFEGKFKFHAKRLEVVEEYIVGVLDHESGYGEEFIEVLGELDLIDAVPVTRAASIESEAQIPVEEVQHRRRAIASVIPDLKPGDTDARNI